MGIDGIRPHRWRALLLVIAVVIPLSLGGTALAQTPRAQAIDFKLVTWLSGLERVVGITHAGDGSQRLFALERNGRIRVAVNGRLQTAPFLDISSLVDAAKPEQGLLGLAFHPRFASNGLFYVAYTSRQQAHVIARYQAAPASSNLINPATGSVILTLPDPDPGHNGGMLAFGPTDGYLYIGLGDGGSQASLRANAQDRLSLLGKILRIDVDRTQPGLAYAVPATNPFVGAPQTRGEIWALGLRNPWRFSFDRLTYDLHITDVGEDVWEEINLEPAGSAGGVNYGWPILEGYDCFDAPTCQRTGLQLPIYGYTHGEGNCSITGGYVYRGTASPALSGSYIFGDFCTGTIWALNQSSGSWAVTQLAQTTLKISSFGEDENGELYVADIATGRVYQLQASGTTPEISRINGGHTAVGAPGVSTSWYFAEGYTAPGFDQYLTLMNPSTQTAEATITFYPASSGDSPIVRQLSVPGLSRRTVNVFDPIAGVGRGRAVATGIISTNGVGLIAERPTYFAYSSAINGGHTAVGATAPAITWYFAEGYTGAGFDEYLTIFNPSPTDARVSLTYYLPDGSTQTTERVVTARSRRTITVHDSGDGIGRDRAVSLRVQSTNGVGIVVERPIYFTYSLNGGSTPSDRVDGGHVLLGVTELKSNWYFAEGYTNTGFDEYLTILNPGPAGTATITYLIEGESLPVVRTIALAATSRTTVAVHAEADTQTNPGGLGRRTTGHSTHVVTSLPTVVERPIYFRYGEGINGGHIVAGVTTPGRTWYFAEGYTGAGFDEYLTIMNPGSAAGQVTITYLREDTSSPTVRTLLVPANSRTTVSVHRPVDAGLNPGGLGRLNVGHSTQIDATVDIVVERPTYFTYR